MIKHKAFGLCLLAWVSAVSGCSVFKFSEYDGFGEPIYGNSIFVPEYGQGSIYVESGKARLFQAIAWQSPSPPSVHRPALPGSPSAARHMDHILPGLQAIVRLPCL